MGVLIFIIGTIMGSFYLVVGSRLPIGKDILFSRSKCESCGYTLKWYNLIPIVSFVFQRGKCSNCHDAISIDHLVVEIATGLLFLFTYLYLPYGYYFYAGLVIVSLVIIIFISDFKYMIILDSPLIISFILLFILKSLYLSLNEALISILMGLLVFLAMLLVSYLGKLILKKESLGGGDIKLSFVIGYILGFRLGITALVFSTFLALPYAVASLHLEKQHEFAYGPFLAGALAIVFFTYDKFDLLFTYLFGF